MNLSEKIQGSRVVRPLYDLDDYDKHGSLKPSAALIAVILFLARDILLPLVVGVASIKSDGGTLEYLLAGTHRETRLLLALPALAVLAASLGRTPDRGDWVRGFWRYGRTVLILTAAMQVPAVLWDLFPHLSRPRGGDFSAIIFALTNVASILFLLASRRAADTFADFPVRHAP